jgi:transposase
MVFIDGTWAKTYMTRTHGWSDKGAPLIDKVPHGHWKTLTFIAAFGYEGIVAPCVLDGPINGPLFTACVEQFLIPALEPGSIVVADNLGSHKGTWVRKLLRAAGIKLFFLPPYSPDLNRSSRCSRSSSASCARPTSAQPRELGAGSETARRLRPRRMPELHLTCRICLNLSQIDSKLHVHTGASSPSCSQSYWCRITALASA